MDGAAGRTGRRLICRWRLVGGVVVLLLWAGCGGVRSASRLAAPRGAPSELALRWYRLANRWVACAPPGRLRRPRWEPIPGCAVYLGEGTGEREVRGAAYLAFIYAVLGTSGPYDERLAGGLPRRDLVGGGVRLIRWLGGTYPRWKGQWQSALWAAVAGQAAWLLWDHLDRPTRRLVRRMVVGEAERFVGLGPPARLRRDSKAEENAWNSLAPALAATMFSSHPRAPLWDRTARRWMLSAYLRPADLRSSRRVDGFPLRSFAGANLLDDFALENHGFFHPDYLACVSIGMSNWLPYRLAGRPLPRSALHNVSGVVGLLKRLSSPDGGVFYPAGQDWETLRRVVYGKVFAQAAVLLDDGEAAGLERLSLRAAERLQGRFDTGAFYAPGERRYFLAEELAAANCAWLYLFHTLAGEGATPLSPDCLRRRLRGPLVLEQGRLALNRTDSSFVSFCWGGRVVAYWTPLSATFEVPPRLDAFLGRVKTPGRRRTYKRAGRVRVETVGDSLVVLASIWRSPDRSLRQDVSLFALPDGALVYLERLSAVREVTELEASADIAREESGKYQKDLATARQTIKAKDEKIQTLTSSIKQLQQKVAQLEAKIKELQAGGT